MTKDLIKSKKESGLYTGIRLNQLGVARHLASGLGLEVAITSKHLWFLSEHKHHKIQTGTIDQILPILCTKIAKCYSVIIFVKRHKELVSTTQMKNEHRRWFNMTNELMKQ